MNNEQTKTPGVEPGELNEPNEPAPPPHEKVAITLTDKSHPECEFAYVDDVMAVNHKPHPFTIGPRHVAHASDKHCGRLGEETLQAIPCAASGCGMGYEHHTHDMVAFVKLKRSAKKSEISAFLRTVVDDEKEWVALNKVDGFVFVQVANYKMLEG